MGFFVVAILLILSAPSGHAAERINIATSARGLVELPVLAAMRNRYYHTEGFEIQKIHIDGEVAVKALLANEVEFLFGWEAPLRAALSGAPLKLIAANVSRPLYALLGRPEIRAAKDLKGKNLGIDEFAGSVDFLSRLAIRYLGAPEKDIEIVEIGASQARVAALRAGAIQATAADLAIAAGLEEEGFKRLVSIGEIADLPVFGVAVPTTKLATQRERVAKFIQATLRGSRFVKRERNATVRTIQSYLKISRAQAARAWEASAPFFTEEGFVSDRVLSFSVRRVEESLQSVQRVPLSHLFDWSIIRDLAAERRKIPIWLRQYDP